MNKMLFFAFILMINIVGGCYMFSLGGIDIATQSGFLGNMAACILFVSIGFFLPLFLWMLPDFLHKNKAKSE